MMKFDWDISDNWDNFTHISQLISDSLARPILLEINPQYPSLILESLKSKSDRNCALILDIFDKSHQSYEECYCLVSSVKSFYSWGSLADSCSYLKDRYKKQSKFYSKESKNEIAAFLSAQKRLFE